MTWGSLYGDVLLIRLRRRSRNSPARAGSPAMSPPPLAGRRGCRYRAGPARVRSTRRPTVGRIILGRPWGAVLLKGPNLSAGLSSPAVYSPCGTTHQGAMGRARPEPGPVGHDGGHRPFVRGATLVTPRGPDQVPGGASPGACDPAGPWAGIGIAASPQRARGAGNRGTRAWTVLGRGSRFGCGPPSPAGARTTGRDMPGRMRLRRPSRPSSWPV